MGNIEKAELIKALNGTLSANKEVGRFKALESSCIDKLHYLINSITIKQNEGI